MVSWVDMGLFLFQSVSQTLSMEKRGIVNESTKLSSTIYELKEKAMYVNDHEDHGIAVLTQLKDGFKLSISFPKYLWSLESR